MMKQKVDDSLFYINKSFEEFLNNKISSVEAEKTKQKVILKINKDGIPTRKNEDWKYTNIDFFATEELPVASFVNPTEEVKKNKVLKDKLAQFNSRIVFFNGKYTSDLSNVPGDLKIVEVFCHDVKSRNNSFLQLLNEAFMPNGVKIEVPNNCILNEPIHILNICAEPTNGQIGKQVLTAPYCSVKIGESSQADFFIDSINLENHKSINNFVFHVEILKNANLSLFQSSDQNTAGRFFLNLLVNCATDSNFKSVNCFKGGKLNRVDMIVSLMGENANADLNGICMPSENHHVDMKIETRHLSPNTTGSQYFKCVLRDKARSVFNGKIYISKNSQKVNSSQLNKNLLLSQDAEADTKPELEVHADDVKAGHGASVGQLDQDEIFYLQSRGMNKQEAIVMLTDAFVVDILDRITDGKIRKSIEGIL